MRLSSSSSSSSSSSTSSSSSSSAPSGVKAWKLNLNPNLTNRTFIMIILLAANPTPSTTRIAFHDNMMGVVYNNSIFLTWNDDPQTWRDAKTICRKRQGSLVSLKTEDINLFVFETFFQETVLKTPLDGRSQEFSSAIRRQPPKREGLSKDFYKYEAWVNGVKAMETSGVEAWLWLGSSPFRFKQFGTGYSDEFWSCLSVCPAKRFAEYGLFWFASDCREKLPYICQFSVGWPADTAENIRHAAEMSGAASLKRKRHECNDIFVVGIVVFASFLTIRYNQI